MSWFRGLRAKLGLIVVISALSVVSLVVVMSRGMNSVFDQIRNLTTVRMPSIKGLEAMNEGQTAVLQVIGLIHAHKSQEDVSDLLKRYSVKRAQIKAGRDIYDPLPQSPDEEVEYKEHFVKAWADWEQSCDAYIDAEKRGDSVVAARAYEQQRQTFAAAEASLDKIITINYANAEKDKAAAQEAGDSMHRLSLMLGVIFTLLVATLGLGLAARISKILGGLTESLSDASIQVTSASTQIASTSEELSQATTEQASSLQETAASLEEITATLKKTSDSAATTASSSRESQQKADQGRTAIEQMLSSMDDIRHSNEDIVKQVAESNRQMTEIVTVIEEIGSKTKVINEIVFQTKLLSFNASVEAARAGEHGKGFAVVAEEVGNLAQMSGNAAREISELLEGSISKVTTIANETKVKVDALIEMGKQKVESGIEVAHGCSDVLAEILKNVTYVATLSHEISQAAQEQTAGVGEINKAMSQIETVTQQNSSAGEESANAAEALSAQAQELNKIVEQLEFVIEGRTRNRATQVVAQKKKPKAPANVVQINRHKPLRTEQAPDYNEAGFSP